MHMEHSSKSGTCLVEERNVPSDHEYAFLGGQVVLDVGAYGLHWHFSLSLADGLCDVSGSLSQNLALVVGGMHGSVEVDVNFLR